MSNGNVIWKCLCDCGNEIEVAYSSLVSSHTMSCGCKRSSKWEEFIAEYLSIKSVDYEREKIFDDCYSNKNMPLRFDFYLPSYNMIIEYDGEQHYKPVKKFGGEQAFKRLQENDGIKNKYCETNNIKLIRLNYKMKKKDIENILNDVLIRNE